ncbi:hypothetical protein C4D60_Mb01t05270 [Musa balbisiana]|uniref:DOMON domain-containing protein n=1 Tax=Musa balbisiana TaxID=52838 RepID=A0A4S8JKA4_MUSBA|nr:hypothetical protein C4D60_Mb01t05270 [Musa balbisiana]
MAITMVSSPALVFLVVVASFLCTSTQAQHSSCDNSFSFFEEGIAGNVTHCRKLRTLGAELGWSYRNTTPNVTLNIVFSAIPSAAGGWVAWGLNPGNKPQMVGTRALIALRRPNGTLAMNTYNLTRDTMLGCKLQPSPIEVQVWNMQANYSDETGAITMSATLSLDPSTYNISELKHVWQVGSSVVDQVVPQKHRMRLKNFDSFEVIDLTTGRGFRDTGLTKQRVAHGVLSVFGWGILLPIGISGYTVGVTAWAIGIALMSNSRHFNTFKGHRTIGIIIFCLATLQIMALWLKPKKKNEGSKIITDRPRKYWSIYHHLVGYTLITLSIVNIFKGFAILRPPPVWKWIYVGLLAALSCVAFGLEAAERSARRAEGVRVVAVGKTKPVSLVRRLYDAGHRCFGENYVQEIMEKAPQIANHLDRAVASLGRKPLKVLVQVNTSGEECLMTIGMPDYTSTPENFRMLSNCRNDVCKALGVPEEQFELSMGMSGDFEQAIEMGSTNVRIGSTIFGPREYPKKNQSQ